MNAVMDATAALVVLDGHESLVVTGERAARVRALVRSGDGVIAHRDLRIDPDARTVTIEGRAIDLTKREFDLLTFLAAQPRQVFSREQLLTAVWRSSPEWQVPATVTEHIRRIRMKIGKGWIQNVRGVGYRFLD